MSSRSKTSFSAGGAGSTVYGVNVNLNTAGGSKKQGLPPFTNTSTPWAMRALLIKANSTPYQRNTIYSMNQLSGVGRGKSEFNIGSAGISHPDGAKRTPPYQFRLHYL